MVRPRSLLAALVVGSAAMWTVVAPPAQGEPVASSQVRVEGTDPLQVTIDSLTPGVVPRNGTITLTGTVTNVSEEVWSEIRAYPLSSRGAPMTTSAELEAAVAADPAEPVGERVTSVHDDIPRLAPGDSASYSLRVSTRDLDLVGTDGVYWLGVHVLGANAAGRDETHDGKARTFIPLVDRDDTEQVPVALALQIRRRIQYTAQGQIAFPERWAPDLAPGGRLHSLVELGAAAGGRPLTWLIDPAVVSSVQQLVAGNPTRDPEPLPVPEEGEPTEEPEATDGTAAPLTTDEGSEVNASTLQVDAQAWLNRYHEAIAGQQVLALPYGDLDVSGASHHAPDLIAGANAESAAATAADLIVSTTGVFSPNGFLNPTALSVLGADATVLVGPDALGEEVAATQPSDVLSNGRRLLVTSPAAVAGGPGPNAARSTVAMRQRILSEAAVRLLDEQPRAMVVMLPGGWAPTDLTGFFPGLDVDWLRLTNLAGLPALSTTDVPELAYPEFQQELELDQGNFVASTELVALGDAAAAVLPPETAFGSTVRREAYATASYWNRVQPLSAASSANRSRVSVAGLLGRIEVETPVSVTFSSDTGRFPVTVHNGLDVPVTVGLDVQSDADVTVEVPDPVTVQPGASARMRLYATASGQGVHRLQIRTATPEGVPFGPVQEFPIRNNEVSRFIWLIMGAGAGILVVMIARRLVKRVRTGRAA